MIPSWCAQRENASTVHEMQKRWGCLQKWCGAKVYGANSTGVLNSRSVGEGGAEKVV